MTSAAGEHINELTALARAWEPERHLAALLAPIPHRPPLIALAACLGDIRRLPHTTSEPVLAAIRLQWWRDSLIEDAMTGYPVAEAMISACRERSIDVHLMLALIDAEETSWTATAPDVSNAAERERLAFTIAAAIAGTPLSAAHDGFLYTAATLYAVTRGDALKAAPDERLIKTYCDHLATISQQFPHLPPALRNIFLPLAVVRPHLRGLQKRWFRANRLRTGLTPLGRAWRIALAHYTGRI